MGASVASTVQHYLADPKKIGDNATSFITGGTADLYKKQKDGEEENEKNKKQNAATIAEAKERVTQEASTDAALKKRNEARSAQRAKTANYSGRGGTILTSAAGLSDEATGPKKTLLGT